MGLLSLAVGVGALAAAALLFTAALRLPTAVDALLTAYLLACALAVVVALAFSPGKWLTRGGLLAASAAVLVGAIAVWWAHRAPAPTVRPAGAQGVDRAPRPVRRPARRRGRGGARLFRGALDRHAANDYDSLWYHLARPAFWAQGHAVGYVANANDQRLDIFPPGRRDRGCMADGLEGSERFASLFQLVALLATIGALAGIGRRLGLTARGAVFGALAFASLPVVALQAVDGSE